MKASLAAFALLAISVAGPCHALACATPVALPAGIVAPAEELQPQVAAAVCLRADDLARRLAALVPVTTVSPPTPTNAHAAPANVSAGGYVPKTKDDNTPWRFDMNQNGRRMTAEEFDAWMKAKGIHVATGKPGVSAAPAAAADCQASATVAC